MLNFNLYAGIQIMILIQPINFHSTLYYIILSLDGEKKLYCLRKPLIVHLTLLFFISYILFADQMLEFVCVFFYHDQKLEIIIFRR
jgi:hypothetical protein